MEKRLSSEKIAYDFAKTDCSLNPRKFFIPPSAYRWLMVKESLKITWKKRPDLLAERLLTKEESRLLQDIKREQEQDSL